MAQENVKVWREGLVNGLRPDRRFSEFDHLLFCTGLMPGQDGLVSHRYLSRLNGTVDAAASWPYPQLFRGSEVTLLVNQTQVYPFTESTLAEGSAYSVKKGDVTYASSTSEAFSASGPWTAAFFGAQWFLANQNALVFSVPQFTSRPNVVEHFKVQCCGAFNGRLILGGLANRGGAVADYFSTTRWTNAFLRWLAFTDDATEQSQAIGDSYVFWSRENGGDVTSPFAAELALFGAPNDDAHDELIPDIYDAIASGEMGFARTTVGTIRHVRQLGGNLVVYGSKGVSVLSAGENGAPIPSEIVVMTRGIPGSGAVGGSPSKHVFVDNSLDVWELSAQPQLQRRGFKEILGRDFTADSNAMVAYDDSHDEFYIGYDANTGYLLDGKGRLSRPRGVPSSILLAGDDIAGTALDADEELVADGDFASSAGWTVGANWSISGGVATFVKKSGDLSQNPVIVDDQVCRLRYTFSSLASGHVLPQVTVTCGGVRTRLVEAAGTYEDYFTAANTSGLFFSPDIHTAGVLNDVSLDSSRRFYIRSGRLHLGVPSLKRLTAIEIVGDRLGGVEVAVLYRYKAKDDYTQSDWLRANDEGVVVPWITALDFQLIVRGYLVGNFPDDAEVSSIPRINVRWQFADLRSIRGQSGAA